METADVKPGKPSREAPIRFLALGDSYTIGESVKPGESWPFQLVRFARDHGIAIDPPTIIAKTGWTTDELLEGIRAASPAGLYQLVSLLIGVNNLYRERSSEVFRAEFRALLDLSLELAGAREEDVVVLSIPDWGATPFAEGKDRDRISRVTDEFNDVCREEALSSSVHYIDVTGFSRMGLDDVSLLTADGLHPSGAMYSLWVEKVFHSVFLDQNRQIK